MAAATYRLYHVLDRDSGEDILVWAYSQNHAVKQVTEKQYAVAPANQRQICRLVANGIYPINEPPEDENDGEENNDE